MTATLTYLSLGAGVQSSALLVMSALGLRGCPRAAFAVFADTQDEPAWVYEHLDALRAWVAPHGIPIVTVTRGRLSDDATLRVPAFVIGKDGPAPLTQNCTRDYKLTPIRQYVRQVMRERGNKRAEVLIGISLDEAHRMRDSRRRWLTNVYPLVAADMRRHDCISLLSRHGVPVPRKSACVYCPWHSGSAWKELLEHDEAGWQKALAFDDRIRAARGASVHRSLLPLRDVTFDTRQQRFDLDGFGNDCEGVCGV